MQQHTKQAIIKNLSMTYNLGIVFFYFLFLYLLLFSFREVSCCQLVCLFVCHVCLHVCMLQAVVAR